MARRTRIGSAIATVFGTTSPITTCKTLASANAMRTVNQADVSSSTIGSRRGESRVRPTGAATKPKINDEMVMPTWAAER